MSRKRERYEAVTCKMPLLRTFVGIDPVGVAECVCIEVANPDGLYVTQDYVVTHNTAASEFLAERPGAEIQLRSRLGQVRRPTVLADYVTISDPSAAAAADVASLSQKSVCRRRPVEWRRPASTGNQTWPTQRSSVLSVVRTSSRRRRSFLSRLRPVADVIRS